MSTTQLYYSVTAKRVRAAVDTLAAIQFDRGPFRFRCLGCGHFRSDPSEEVFRASGIGRTDESETLRTRVGQLEQQVLDLRQELEERTGDLDASHRDLMTLANRKPAGPGWCTAPVAHKRRQHTSL